ncbi:MAG: hypothetical protein VB961_13495 [Dehalococcoidia bacterium]
MSAEKRWTELRGFQRLGHVIRGVKFSDGTSVVADEGGVEDGLICMSAA